MTYTVEAYGLCTSFGHHLVLDHPALSIEEGSVLALLGPDKVPVHHPSLDDVFLSFTRQEKVA